MHLKWIVSFSMMLVLTIFVSGCTGTNDGNRYSEERDKESNGEKPLINENVPDLEIRVDPPSICVSAVPEFVSITVTNTSEDLAYEGSYHYSIEYWDGGEWINTHCPAVQDDSLIINPTKSTVFNYIQLNPMEYDYSVGKYRVNFNNRAYGEFLIVDE